MNQKLAIKAINADTLSKLPSSIIIYRRIGGEWKKGTNPKNNKSEKSYANSGQLGILESDFENL